MHGFGGPGDGARRLGVSLYNPIPFDELISGSKYPGFVVRTGYIAGYAMYGIRGWRWGLGIRHPGVSLFNQFTVSADDRLRTYVVLTLAPFAPIGSLLWRQR
jgi:hypothetical protein